MSIRAASTWLAAAAATVLLSVAAASASNSRNAPTIDNFSAVDIADLYLFRNPSGCQPGPGCNLVVILTVQPLADPSFGPTYHFQPNALYRLNFSTTPDAILKGIASAKIDFVFSPFGNNDSTCPAPSPPCQSYRATFPNGVVVDGLTTQGSAAATPNQPVITQFPLSQGQISVFAGPREDPFFFDYVGFQRFLADVSGQLTTPVVPHFSLFTGKDAFLGKNVNAITVEFPLQMLLPPGSTKLTAWAETYLSNSLRPRDQNDDDDAPGGFQVDRIGNPLVNWLLIPPNLNDAFDFSKPRRQARDFSATITGNLIRFGINPAVLPAVTTALIPDTLKFDTNLPDGYLAVPPNGRRLTDRTTDFLLTLFFNVQGPPASQQPGGVTCPGIAQTAFSDCTAPKVPSFVFPFIGPPLQPTP